MNQENEFTPIDTEPEEPVQAAPQAAKKPHNKGMIVLSVIGGIIIAALVVALVLTSNQKKLAEQKVTDFAEIEEQLNQDKETLQQQYEELYNEYGQFDTYTGRLSNDSLVAQLAQERQHVLDLLEELKNTRASNAKEINRLRKELDTLRSVMRQYVQQIDELSQDNTCLKNQNEVYRTQLDEKTQQTEQLQQEKEQLTSVVQRAAMMEIADFRLATLNDRDKETRRYSKIAKLRIDFTVLKNITATPGNKTVYLRLIRPDGELLVKPTSGRFHFENKDIEYSISKDFEYTGDAISQTLYWRVEEVLPIGTYDAEFFIDGNLVGSFPFKIEK